jgi:type I restriction enzyme, S subunit
VIVPDRLDGLRGPWPTKRLKFVAPASSERSDASAGNTKYVGLENVESWTGRLIESKNDAVSDEKEGSFGTAGRFFAGDVLFGKLRPYLAKAALADRVGVCSTEFLVLRPRDELDARFLRYILLCPQVVSLIDSSTFGAKMPRAGWDSIGSIRIPIPSKKDQRRIADYLAVETAEIDALVAEKDRMLALAEEKHGAVVARSVTRGLDSGVSLKPTGIGSLGDLPAHWDVERLKFHLVRLEQGWSPECDSFPAEDGEWGVLKVGAVNQWEFNPAENKRLPDELPPLLEYEIRPRDVLMSRANTTQLLGSVVFVREVDSRLLLCDKLYRLDISEERLSREYAVAYLRSAPGRFRFEQEATGASNSMQNIGQDTVRNTWIPIPPLAEQSAIVAYLAAERGRTEKLTTMLRESILLLKERRSALITAAVTGQIPLERMAV